MDDRERSEQLLRRGHVVAGLVVLALGAAMHLEAPGSAEAWMATACHGVLAGILIVGSFGIREGSKWQGLGFRGRVPTGAGFSNASACLGILGGGVLVYAILWGFGGIIIVLMGHPLGLAFLALAAVLAMVSAWLLRQSKEYMDRIGKMQ